MTAGSDDSTSDVGELNEREGDALVVHDWTASGQPSTGIVEAVSATTNRPVTDGPPLHDVIDADALDALLTAEDVEGAEPTTVSFVYDEVHVTVDATGRVAVRPASSVEE